MRFAICLEKYQRGVSRNPGLGFVNFSVYLEVDRDLSYTSLLSILHAPVSDSVDMLETN